jgi:hypothetical protein
LSRRSLAALALFIAAFLIYLNGFHYAGSGDTQPAELLPVTLLRRGDFDFREFVEPAAALPYWYQNRLGRVISIYPILPGLLNVPIYAVAGALGVDLYDQRIRLSMISAALISALSVAFLFLALDHLVRRRSTAVLLAAAYAFGTCAWSVASRGMFQHGPSLLLQSIALWLLARGDRASAAWSGLFLGLAVVNRPTNLLVAAPLAAIVCWKHRRRALAFCTLAAVPLLLRAMYARAYWGSPFSLAQADPFPAVSNFGGNAARGLAGLLASPSRGLLVYSPIFLFVALAIRPAWRSRRQQPLFLALLAGALAILLVTSKWTIWWGGHSYGYRLLIEMLPALILLLALAWENAVRDRPVWKAAFLACLGWSVFLQAFGARHQPTGFNQKLDEDPSVLWSLSESDVARAIRSAFPAAAAGGRGGSIR